MKIVRSNHAGFHGCSPQHALGDCRNHRPWDKTVAQNHEPVGHTDDLGQTGSGHHFNACLRNLARIRATLLAEKMISIDLLRVHVVEESRHRRTAILLSLKRYFENGEEAY